MHVSSLIKECIHISYYRVIKAGLNDTSCLKRERKEAPHSSLGLWRSNKRLKKDAMFFEPLLTGKGSILLIVTSVKFKMICV